MDAPNKLFNQLSQGLSWTFAASILIGISNFVAQIWFARILGVSVIGQYAFFVVTIELSLLIVNFGFNQSVIRHRGDALIFNGALALVLMQIVIIVLIMALVFFGYYLTEPEQAVLLLLPCIIMVFARILAIFSTVLYAPLESELQYEFLSKARLVSTLMGLFFAGAMVMMGAGIYTLVARDLITALLLTIFVWYHGRPRLVPNFSFAAIGPVWRFTLPLWGLNVLERGALRLDYALIGLILGIDALGIYFQIRSIIEGVLGLIINPVQTVLYSFYCRYTNRALLFNRALSHGNLIILIPAIILAILILPFSKPLIGFVLGEAWIQGSGLLPGLMLYAWSLLWFENVKVMAMSENLHHLTLWGRFLQILMLATLVIPLTMKWGFAGAGAATGCAAISLATLSTKLLTRRLRVLWG